MPTAATTVNGTAGGTSQGTGGNANPGPAVVPFVRASQQHREPAGVDVTKTMTAADQDLGVFPIPAYGYLRSLTVLVQATGGAGTSVTAAEDGPFNAVKNILLQEPNGAVIVQFNSGYDCYLANKYGGYRYANDPKASPVYSAVAGATGNFQFLLRIPLELNIRDALGSLPNQNSSAQFQLRVTLSASATIYGTVPTTLPSVRVRVFTEAWDQPELSTDGAPNQTTPPAMNTTQYWSVQQYAVNAGAINIRLTRMGNYIRNLIFVFRAATRAAGATNWPTTATLYWDTRPLDIIEQNNWNQQIFERYGYGQAGVAYEAANGLDNGVFPYDFCSEFDGRVGHENRDLWLPTIGSTRFEIGGTWGAAGTLYVLTNDVSVAGNVFL